MLEYRKRKGTDIWHWCTNCSQWPTANYDSQKVMIGERPKNGELDNECLGREQSYNCDNVG